MTGGRALAVSALAGAAAILAADSARAQTPESPHMASSVDTDVTAVGETIQYTLQASHEEEMPHDPQPGPVPGFVVRGRPQMTPLQMQMNMNGVYSVRRRLDTTWLLEAQRTGTFNLGPATVMVGNHRFTSRSVTVRVLAAGQAPRHDTNDPFFNPFSTLDPWKALMNPGGDDDPSALRKIPPRQTDPHLALPSPRGRDGFLHAELDKTAAVVGEQVTYSVYWYSDVSLLRFPTFNEDHEPSLDDFIQHPLLQAGSEAKMVGNAQIGDATYEVRLVKRLALFPLAVGDLEIGPMAVTLDHRRQGEDFHRDTERLLVHVTEPPVAGRPPGYAIGDVGSFAMSADVAPREVESDGAVSVSVSLTGTGNLPASLHPPARADVEWLDGQTRDNLGPQGDPGAPADKWGGQRTYAFVARVHHVGTVDLGDISLPYWDPSSRTYAVARAHLGTVDVKPGAAAPPSAAEQVKLLDGLPAPRPTLAGPAPARRYLDDSPLFWVGLGLSPLAYAAATFARASVRKLKERREERAASPATELKARLAAAERAARGDDPRALDAATARVLESLALAKAGVNVRGARDEERAKWLEEAGVSADAAGAFAALLAECEAARFAPDAPTLEAARGRWQRARASLDGLGAR